MKLSRQFGYSLLGGGGALGPLLVGRGCLGGCSGCYGCLAVPGLIVGLALIKSIVGNRKGEKHGLASGDH